MRRSTRVIASALGMTLSLTACGGHSSLPMSPSDTAGAITKSAPQAAAAQLAPMISIPRTFGSLAFSDAGRRAANKPVGITLTLRYNDQAGLDRFVASLGSERGKRHVLTPQQFNERYAPTVKQEENVV